MRWLAFAGLLCFIIARHSSGFVSSSGGHHSTKPQRPGAPLCSTCPPASPATGLENRFFTWKEGQKIRYQCTGKGPPVLLVHGLFVNSDHWRKTLQALSQAGYTAYAIDLLGCGYSDKPPAVSTVAERCNGESDRFGSPPAVLEQVKLGTAQGGQRVADVDLRHPLGSPYNFFTWADLLQDFTQEVILPENTKYKKATLVCNSIGTISAFQAVLDAPSDIYNGVFVVCPNFRELHSAEVPFSSYTMPLIRSVQSLLRNGLGQKAFDALAKPGTVKQILMEPYAVESAVDDTLVQVLLDPLLTQGASDVVFDTLSYSAGPLPEQQLESIETPVWVCYGDKDPWTPAARVEALIQYPAVEKVVKLAGVGHCPHDEAPELVNPLLEAFLTRLKTGKE